MPSPINTPLPTVGGSVTVTTTTETVVVVSAVCNTDAIESVVLLDALVDLTIGTGGLTATLSIRRGNGITGTVVAAIGPLTVVAGNRQQFSHLAVDKPGLVTGMVYSFTVTIGSASGNSTANFSALALQVQQAA